MSSMDIRVDAESERPKSDEIKLDFEEFNDPFAELYPSWHLGAYHAEQIERACKLFDEENGENIFNLSFESIRRLKWRPAELYGGRPWGGASHLGANHAERFIEPFAHSLYYDNNFGNNVEHGRLHMSSRKDGAGPYDDVLGHSIVDIPEAVDDDKRVKLIDNWADGLMAPVAQQAVAGLLTNRIADTNNLGVHLMEIAIALGLGFKLAGVTLKRNKRPNLSIWMGKVGDMLTASAIILSLAMHLPPLMACIVAPLAFLLIAFAVAFA